MNIRLLEKTDIAVIVDGFKESGWQSKPTSIFEQYLDDGQQDQRICLVAFVGEKFAGYVTLKWQSDYKIFADDNIPEISDLNVLPSFRNKGIGSALIKKCEEYAAQRSNIVGIGVGLYPDYGSAQRLYIKRGYLPDGHGATYNYEYVTPGKEYPLDDELVLWFIKNINTTHSKILPLNLNNIDTAKYSASFVGCVVLTYDDKILLQYRPLNWRTYPGYLTTFGGKVESGETTIEATIRELKEELGAEVKSEDLVEMGLVTEEITQYTELVYHYFWHDKEKTITGCYECEPRYFDNVKDVLKSHKIMDDLKYLLNKIKENGLLD